MVRTLLGCAFVLTVLPAWVRAQTPEELKGLGGLTLERSLGLALGQARRWTLPAASPGNSELGRYLLEHAQVASIDGTAASTDAAAQIDLAKLLNRQWKTPASFPMGGQTAFIGGAFDRQQNAFVSVYAAGWAAPKFFNIKGLLDKEGVLTVGAVNYTVTLSANVLHPMKSEIVFENKANENDAVRISVKKLLDSLSAAGDTLKLSDQSYQVFYYNDVKDGPGGPAIDPSSRTFALILTEGEDLHVFLIPAETVPSAQVAVFKMFKDKRVGLQVAGTTLKVFENP